MYYGFISSSGYYRSFFFYCNPEHLNNKPCLFPCSKLRVVAAIKKLTILTNPHERHILQQLFLSRVTLVITYFITCHISAKSLGEQYALIIYGFDSHLTLHLNDHILTRSFQNQSHRNATALSLKPAS